MGVHAALEQAASSRTPCSPEAQALLRDELQAVSLVRLRKYRRQRAHRARLRMDGVQALACPPNKLKLELQRDYARSRRETVEDKVMRLLREEWD